jgi:hypothetical protein
MIKKKEDRTISPFYGIGPPLIRSDPPFPSRLPKPHPSSNNNSINSNTSFTNPTSTTPPASTINSNHSTTNNHSNYNSPTNSHNTFSLSALGAVLPSTSSKKEKTSRGVIYPMGGWTNSWETSSSSSFTPYPSTHGNPLYQPRMFADVVLTDSHPRRLEREEIESPRRNFSNVSWL